MAEPLSADELLADIRRATGPFPLHNYAALDSQQCCALIEEYDRLAAECVRLTEQNERLDLDYQAAVHRSNEATKQAALEKIARKAADRDNEQLQRDKAYYMRHSERWHQTTSARFETVTDECDHWRAEVARYRESNCELTALGIDRESVIEELRGVVARYRTTLENEAGMLEQSVATLQDLHDNWERIAESETADGEPAIQNILYWLIEDLSSADMRAALGTQDAS